MSDYIAPGEHITTFDATFITMKADNQGDVFLTLKVARPDKMAAFIWSDQAGKMTRVAVTRKPRRASIPELDPDLVNALDDIVGVDGEDEVTQ